MNLSELESIVPGEAQGRSFILEQAKTEATKYLPTGLCVDPISQANLECVSITIRGASKTKTITYRMHREFLDGNYCELLPSLKDFLDGNT